MELAEEERREYDDMAEGLRLQLLGLLDLTRTTQKEERQEP